MGGLAVEQIAAKTCCLWLVTYSSATSNSLGLTFRLQTQLSNIYRRLHLIITSRTSGSFLHIGVGCSVIMKWVRCYHCAYQMSCV